MGHELIPLHPDRFSKWFILDKTWKQRRLYIIPVIRAFHSLTSNTNFRSTAFRYPPSMRDIKFNGHIKSCPICPGLTTWYDFLEHNGKKYWVFGEKSRDLGWYLKIFVFWAHIIRFLWKLPEEKRSGVKKAAFQTRYRLGLPDVTLCHSGGSLNSRFI